MKLTDTFTRFVEIRTVRGRAAPRAAPSCRWRSRIPRSADAWLGFWQLKLGPLSVEHWINDALMAVFFLFIGLELERELYVGELSKLRNALLPAFAAVGGMIAPALFHFALNGGTPTQAGFGIPMATDIAFALGVLALLGNRVPAGAEGLRRRVRGHRRSRRHRADRHGLHRRDLRAVARRSRSRTWVVALPAQSADCASWR